MKHGGFRPFRSAWLVSEESDWHIPIRGLETSRLGQVCAFDAGDACPRRGQPKVIWPAVMVCYEGASGGISVCVRKSSMMVAMVSGASSKL